MQPLPTPAPIPEIVEEVAKREELPPKQTPLPTPAPV